MFKLISKVKIILITLLSESIQYNKKAISDFEYYWITIFILINVCLLKILNKYIIKLINVIIIKIK